MGISVLFIFLFFLFLKYSSIVLGLLFKCFFIHIFFIYRLTKGIIVFYCGKGFCYFIIFSFDLLLFTIQTSPVTPKGPIHFIYIFTPWTVTFFVIFSFNADTYTWHYVCFTLLTITNLVLCLDMWSFVITMKLVI